MNQDDSPAPETGFVVTHFLVVSDQNRSREYYESVFGATVVNERDPVILRLANSWLILNVGGGPTDDKPAVTLAPFDQRLRSLIPGPVARTSKGWDPFLPKIAPACR